MEVKDVKKLLQAIDELETQFAEQKAHYEARSKVLTASVISAAKEMAEALEGVPPEKWPKGVAPAEGTVK